MTIVSGSVLLAACGGGEDGTASGAADPGTTAVSVVPVPSATPTPTPTPTPEPTVATPSAVGATNQWVKCADEGGFCQLSYDTSVRYGIDGAYLEKVIRAGQFGCGNGTFGSDPASGKAKFCTYQVRDDAKATLSNAAGFQLGVNLGGLAYYSGQPALANLMTGEKWRDLTGWESRRSQVVDAKDNLHLQSGDRAAKNLTIPVGVLKGENTPIVCTWEGKGSIDIGGQRTPVSYGSNKATFTYVISPQTKGELVWFTVNSANASDPIRNIDCREARLARNVVFTPEVVADLKPYKVLRFLDWSAANGNPPVLNWGMRTLPDSGNQAEGPTGVALELQTGLANQIGADAWFNVPWNADEDYQRRMAKLIHDGMPANQKVYVELSNEVWNWVFLATHQASKEGLAEGLSTDPWEAAMLRYAEKTRWMMKIWSEVFADRPGQLVRVGAIQTGGGAAEIELGRGGMADSVDAIAIAPYIGNDILAKYPNSTDTAALLSALASEVPGTSTKYSEVKNVLRRYGKRLIAYEAGQHMTGGNIDMIRAVNRAPEMETIYRNYLSLWKAEVNDTMVLYHSAGPISQYGAWGLQEYTGQPLSETPKRRAALAFAG